MGEQEALIDPTHHSLWARFIDQGTINHAAWLRACAEAVMVGTCRTCGQHLHPRHPEQVTPKRVDYEAECVNGHKVCAPNGKLGKVWKGARR